MRPITRLESVASLCEFSPPLSIVKNIFIISNFLCLKSASDGLNWSTVAKTNSRDYLDSHSSIIDILSIVILSVSLDINICTTSLACIYSDICATIFIRIRYNL